MAITRVVKIKRKRVDIIELGKGLFRRGGVILMPGKLGTADGPKDEASDKAELLKKAGIKALAAVFKQFEFDNRKRLVIAGHADDAKGGTKEKFDLSALRAKAVLHLLRGEVYAWAELCQKNHNVEDIQRILKFFHVCKGWDCDPKAINGTWSDNVFKATGKFVEGYDGDHATMKIPPGVLDALKTNKLWPVQLWRAVFRLFDEEICTALKIVPPDPANLARGAITFVQAGKETVACGESFPLQEDESNYRKTNERKVDLIFYNEKEAPGVHPAGIPFVCAAHGPTKHVWQLCPIWRQKTILVRYIDPEKDLNSVAYHLGFTYFNDVIADGVPRSVPEGLVVNAYRYVKMEVAKPKTKMKIEKTKMKIDGRSSFSDCVYTLVVPDDPSRTNINFEFVAKYKDKDSEIPLWVFSKDKTTSEIVAATPAEIAKLTLPDKLEERFKYYDLPREWSSENYWTRYKGADGKWKGGRFFEVMKNEKKLKPYGTAKTTADKPLIFSLDDIVLVDEKGNQNINAVGKKPGDKLANNEKTALGATSRVSILYVNKVKNGDLVLYNPLDANAPYFSKNPFLKNLIADVPQGTRMVIFANDFYSVYDKRTGQDGWPCNLAQGHIKGCRAAKLKDADSHFGMRLRNTSGGPGTLYYARACGNFELHYVHNGCLIKDPDLPDLKVRSFLIVYWNGVFVASTIAGKPHPITEADLRRYRTEGLMNAKKRWDDKGYTIEPHTASADGRGKVQIKPVFFFEAKLSNVGGKPKCTVKITNNNKDGEMGIFGSKMYWEDFQHTASGWGPTTGEIDGKAHDSVVVAHEVGHAIGKMDDYAYDTTIPGDLEDDKDGKFCQWYPGMPYHNDENSIMCTNRAPRMRHIWFYVNRLNDAAAADAELKPLLNGTIYEVVYRYGAGAGKKTQKYFLPKSPEDYRNIYVPFKQTRRALVGVGGIRGGGDDKRGVDLFLYKLGDDEYARNIKISPPNPKPFAFDGILVVFIKMNYRFVNVGAHKWNKAMRLSWRQDVDSELTILNNNFYIERTGGTGGLDFKNTLLLFYPIGLVGQPKGSHYTIQVSRNTLKSVTRYADGKEIRIGGQVPKDWVARYVLGHDSKENVVSNPVPTIGKSDLLFARDWLNAQLGGTVNFVVKDT